LYHAGFTVGKYISLERIIEQSKETYYETLEKSSQNWHEENHDPQPWLRYFYGTLIRAYKEFEARAGAVRDDLSKTKQVKDFIDQAVIPFSIADIQKEYPNISKEMIRLVLRELRDEDKIYATSKGRGAKWIKK
jgi:Fic family protein